MTDTGTKPLPPRGDPAAARDPLPPAGVSSAFDRPGLCDMAAGEAETCLGKLTTLRSFRASPRALERHQKLDQVDGRKRDQTSRCRRFRYHTCSHEGIAPRARGGAGCRKRLAARAADKPRPRLALAALRNWRSAGAGPTIRFRPRLGLGFREVDRSHSPAYRGRVHCGKSSSGSLTHTNGIPC
jgi:hypothetical protein